MLNADILWLQFEVQLELSYESFIYIDITFMISLYQWSGSGEEHYLFKRFFSDISWCGPCHIRNYLVAVIIIIITVWLIRWQMLPFLQELSMRIGSVPDDSWLPGQCWVVQGRLWPSDLTWSAILTELYFEPIPVCTRRFDTRYVQIQCSTKFLTYLVYTAIKLQWCLYITPS